MVILQGRPGILYYYRHAFKPEIGMCYVYIGQVWVHVYMYCNIGYSTGMDMYVYIVIGHS